MFGTSLLVVESTSTKIFSMVHLIESPVVKRKIAEVREGAITLVSSDAFHWHLTVCATLPRTHNLKGCSSMYRGILVICMRNHWSVSKVLELSRVAADYLKKFLLSAIQPDCRITL